MKSADFLVIGGGIAGISASAKLAQHGSTIVLEAESAFGYHASGRSAAFYHFGIGDETIRALTAYCRAFFEAPPPSFSEHPLGHPAAALFVATAAMREALDVLEADMRCFTQGIERVGEAQMKALVPFLKVGTSGIVAGVVDNAALKLDADALQQGYRRAVRSKGGETISNARVVSIERQGGNWLVVTAAGEVIAAGLLINAAGAWADQVASMAGVQTLGLRPMRRTIIVTDPPSACDIRTWPFTKTVVDDFYMLPEGGRLAASPVDEIPSEPVDARPDDYDIALAAAKVEQYTSIPVSRIRHSWAGLRTFTADRLPAVGFAPDAEGFFWLAGQGGFGLQTAPAMSEVAEALLIKGAWPPGLHALGVGPELFKPERLLPSSF